MGIYSSSDHILDLMPIGCLCAKEIYKENGLLVDLQVIKCNKAFEVLTDLKSENLVGKMLSKVITNSNLDRLIKDKKENNGILKIGDKHYKITYDTEELGNSILYFTDVSEIINEKSNRNIAYNSADIQVWYLESPSIYHSANKSHSEFLGRSEEELEKADVNDLLSEEEAKVCIEGNTKAFEQRQPLMVKEWVYNHKGDRRLLKTTKTPRFNIKGEIEVLVCTAEDVTDAYNIKKQSDIKEKILYSSLAFTEELLTNKDHYKALSNGLEMLGNATQVDRVYYWENHYDEPSKKWLTSQKFEWCLGDVSQQIDNPDLQDIPFEDVGDFIEELSQNKPFIGHIKDMDSVSNTKRILEEQKILSILVLPVFINKEFRGFIGFDSCNLEKEWSQVELSLLNSFVLLYIKALERQILEHNIQQSKDNFDNFFNMIQDFLFVLDYDGNILDVNRSVLKVFGYRREELIGKPVLILHPENKIEEVQKNIASLISKELQICDIPAVKKNGEVFPVQTAVSEGIWDGENVLFAISKDITELLLSEERFSKAFNTSGVSMIISKLEDGTILEANDTFLKLVSRKKKDVIGKNSLNLNLTDKKINMENIKKGMEENGHITDMQIKLVVNKEEIRTCLVNIISLNINNEDCLLSSIVDITERIQYEEKILDLSNKDSLTGVYNRRFVYKAANDLIYEFKRGTRVFSVCILDIDRFKAVNDSYGHHIGDCVLKEFVKVINTELREYDILGRYGGEEFVILLNNCKKEEGLIIINRILNKFRNSELQIENLEIKITFSAGISDCTELEANTITIDKLISMADARMYNAKKAGRNRVSTN